MNKCKCGYGEIIFTRDMKIVQALGIPSPEGYCIVMPKYIASGKGGPWAFSNIIKFKRIIQGYGPMGVLRAQKLSEIKEVFDPFYNSKVPVAAYEDILYCVNPVAALYRLFFSPKSLIEINSIFLIFNFLQYTELSINNIGITGSLAGGYYHSSSDIDIVVYGKNNIIKVYDYFTNKNRVYEALPILERNILGGVTVKPQISLTWRRGFVKTSTGLKGITWIGVPREPASHCLPLTRKTSINPPVILRSSIIVEVEPGQLESLLYPPCIRDKEGRHIISFEYNLGDLFYRGGKFRVKALSSIDGSIIYIGLREFPGLIERI